MQLTDPVSSRHTEEDYSIGGTFDHGVMITLMTSCKSFPITRLILMLDVHVYTFSRSNNILQ